MESFYYNLLTEFYRRYNKDSAPDIVKLLEKYQCSEKELVCSLFKKYSGDPFEFEFFRNYIELGFQEFLISFYEKFNPERVSQVPSLTEKYNDNKEELIKQLCLKYDIRPYSLVEFLHFQDILNRNIEILQARKTNKGDFYEPNVFSKKTSAHDMSQNKYLYVIAGIIIFFCIGGVVVYKVYNNKKLEQRSYKQKLRIADSIRVTDSLAMTQANQQRIADSLAMAQAEKQRVTDSLTQQQNNQDNNIEDNISESESNSIYSVVEEQPSYPGGDEARIRFLQANMKYPEEAKERGVQGKVFVTFIVEVNGSLSNISVLKGIGRVVDEEAIRVVKLMPKWIPGKMKGVPVRVQFNLPIKFTLN
jgi:TonB family protein